MPYVVAWPGFDWYFIYVVVGNALIKVWLEFHYNSLSCVY